METNKKTNGKNKIKVLCCIMKCCTYCDVCEKRKLNIRKYLYYSERNKKEYDKMFFGLPTEIKEIQIASKIFVNDCGNFD